MRIHITGMSPRMVSRRAREQVTFARTLERALVDLGHQVYRGPDDDPADLVLAGVTSALSPAATYAMVGLEHIGCALKREIPLLLFVDDPDLNKTQAGAQSAARDPDRLYTPYLMSKRVKQSRHLNELQRRRVDAAVQMLSSETWAAPVLVPLHPWGSPAIAAKRMGVVSDLLPVDVSSAVALPPAQAMDHEKAKLWLTDRHYSRWLLVQARVTWPVVPIDSTTLASPAHVYSVARGVHQGTIARIPGWWTPTPTYAAHACTVYLSDSEETEMIGTDTPYYLTPDQVEALDRHQHRDLARAQAEHLKEVSWDRATLSSHLEDWIGRASSSRKRATRKPTSRTS